MEVRRAKLADMGRIVNYLDEYHKTSNMSTIKFVRRDMVKIIEYYIAARDSWPGIAVEKEGNINGVLFGSLEPFFFNSKEKWATDLMFIAKGGGIQLLREFKKWAFDMGAERIMMGVSSGQGSAGTVLEFAGFTELGGMYVLRKESV